MKTASFYRASAIRQQSRAGRSVAELAAVFCLSLVTVEKIVACRTREAAAKVLDTKESSGLVKRFVVSGGSVVDFSNLIQYGEK